MVEIMSFSIPALWEKKWKCHEQSQPYEEDIFT